MGFWPNESGCRTGCIDLGEDKIVTFTSITVGSLDAGKFIECGLRSGYRDIIKFFCFCKMVLDKSILAY